MQPNVITSSKPSAAATPRTAPLRPTHFRRWPSPSPRANHWNATANESRFPSSAAGSSSPRQRAWRQKQEGNRRDGNRDSLFASTGARPAVTLAGCARDAGSELDPALGWPGAVRRRPADGADRARSDQTRRGAPGTKRITDGLAVLHDLQHRL